jgi:hypothetical protein
MNTILNILRHLAWLLAGSPPHYLSDGWLHIGDPDYPYEEFDQ